MIPFTQYHRPDGRTSTAYIARPREIEQKAFAILKAGYVFECELLTTGEVSLTIANAQGDLAIVLCPKGPDVSAAVDRLITEFTP